MIKRLKALHIFNAAKLSAATAVGQVISYAAAPILSRLFSPQDFALFASFYAWIVPLAVFSTLRFEFSIPGTATESEAWSHARWSLRTSSLIAVALSALLFLTSIFGVIHWHWSFLIGIGVLSISWAQVYNFLTTRLHAFKLNASSRIINNAVLNGVSILLGWLGMLQWGLVAGFVIGQLATILFLVLALRRSAAQQEVDSHHPTIPWATVKPYVLFNTPQGILETLQLSGIIAALEWWFSSAVTGAYYLCWRFLQAPVTLISNTIFLSQYPKASELRREGKGYRRMIVSTGAMLFGLSAPVGIVLFIWGPELFAWFFGSEWRTAGEYAGWLAPWFVFNFSVSPFSYASLIEGRQKTSLIITSVDVCVKVACLYWGHLYADAVSAIALFSVASSFILFITYLWYLRLAK
ncbi:MAG: lipopolysaccharide biosynthesis protein [Flavobacteriales bacterium]